MTISPIDFKKNCYTMFIAVKGGRSDVDSNFIGTPAFAPRSDRSFGRLENSIGVVS
jgi:hypothetical protein